MAMTQKDRDERRSDKAARLQEEDLRLRVGQTTKRLLSLLMTWGVIKQQGEALTLMIHHVQGLGRSGVIRLLCSLHKIEQFENVEHIESAMIRFKARPGTLAALADIVDWSGAVDQGSAMSLVIHTLHDAGPDRAARFLALPPHPKYIIPAHVATRLQLAYNREALRICHDE